MPPPFAERLPTIVRRIERSVAFYRDVLGLSVWYDDRVTLSGVGLAAGARGDETHLVIMQASDPVVGKIGLLEFTQPRLPEPPFTLAGLLRRNVFICLFNSGRQVDVKSNLLPFPFRFR